MRKRREAVGISQHRCARESKPDLVRHTPPAFRAIRKAR